MFAHDWTNNNFTIIGWSCISTASSPPSATSSFCPYKYVGVGYYYFIYKALYI